MHLKKLHFIILLSLVFSSCVLIQESRNKKKLANVEYVKKYDEVKDTFKITEKKKEEKKEEIDNNKSNNIVDSDKIWYHPNPWWKISSKPFPVDKDSFKYIKNAPQYGFTLFINPLTNQLEKDGWNDWQIVNHQLYEDGAIIHNWQTFIALYKDDFSNHPEYLAEIDGKRLGFGKSNKLCVTNKNLQKLYVDYTNKRIQDNPKFKFFSIEPSDGAGFCSCVNCSKLGSISNQVFYFANQIAKEIKKSHPDKQLGIYAYNTHSDPPNFSIEENVKVVLAPEGFQTNYSNLGILLDWSKIHHNMGIYEYFGIPQWKGEQPRIVIKDLINRIKFAEANHFDMIIFESSTNLNSTLLMSMLSSIMMNPNLTWDEVYNRFLDNCFKDSKKPIQRLFNRWHSIADFNATEINYSIYDLNEASNLTKNANELQRIRDLKAYLHYLVLYNEWGKDRTNSIILKQYFDYLYNSGNRNIVNVNALTQMFAATFSNDAILKSKYTYKNILDKAWIKFITDTEIENNFKNDLKNYPPIFKENLSNQDIKKIAAKTNPQQLLDNYDYQINARNSLDVFSSDKSISIVPTFTQKDIQTMMSIYSKEGIFIQQKLLNNNESWTVQLPEPGIYTIMQNRVNAVQVNIKGKFAPILTSAPKTTDKLQTIQTVNKNLELEKMDKAKSMDSSNPVYIITK